MSEVAKGGSEFDAIVVGAGAAGGIVACVLAEAGNRVLLLERGPAVANRDVGRDHLRNARLAQYGTNGGPDPRDVRVLVDLEGREHLRKPHQPGYQNNAAMVGGGTQIYGGQAWRFLPDDFRMASRYGVPEGSSLADWPIGYDDLEPFYERAEREIGVAGDSETSARVWPRRSPYPMPPVWDNPQRLVLREAAARLGWSCLPAPLLVNSVAYNGRPPCGRCGMCVGFACPTNGKNGTHNTAVPRALATGRCTLISHAYVTNVELDRRGHARGVRFFVDDPRGNGPVELRARAKVVVSSGGAVESARLLLNSATGDHPRGLGNAFDQVGRHLQGHAYPGAHGVFADEITDNRGPGVSIATTQFNHGNPDGLVGGAMLANEFVPLPISFVKGWWPPDVPRWGIEAKRWARHGYRRTVSVQGPVQEIPSPDARVQVDANVRDRFGMPVARCSGCNHAETRRVGEFMRGRAEQWLHAAGAVKVWGRSVGPGLSGGQHQAGTCRMGNDPKTSVCDATGRVHDCDNVYVVDGSLHVTNGGFNPVLTIMALAFRCAERIAERV
jgi:choline dehydrogenase-like flavoprotein